MRRHRVILIAMLAVLRHSNAHTQGVFPPDFVQELRVFGLSKPHSMAFLRMDACSSPSA
jgi:hypothetical protein